MTRQRTEESEQKALIDWADLIAKRFPEGRCLRWLFHVPNGMRVGIGQARRFKAMGVRKGVPDLWLPVPRGDCHGLVIEMKSARGYPTKAQKKWLACLEELGFSVHVCRGMDEAAQAIAEYLALPDEVLQFT